jgi:sugar lactone lactonase YvrE
MSQSASLSSVSVPPSITAVGAATRLDARLLRGNDDVATALVDLPAGALLRVSSGGTTREVTLREDIRAGHKFAVRALAAGLRIRKYGEFIGRTTTHVAAGAWVHVHNLATSSRHSTQHEQAWYDHAETSKDVHAIGETRCSVGESPVFDATSNRLYWVDVRDTPAIHMLELDGGRQQSWPLREDIGSLVLAGADRLLVALRSGFAFFDCTSGALAPIFDPESTTPQTRLNDGKCDALGRFWCGSMNPESGIAEGSLYMLDGNLRCTRVLPDWVTPNGMTWSLDNATMFIADTRRGMIDAFEFDLASGTLGARRTFADLGAFPGGPDGAAIDAEGFVWSAQFDGGCLIRYAPDGRMDRVIRLPVSRPASCAFGGPGYRQLFVTTATRGMNARQLEAEPLAGRVLALDVGVAGLPPVAFAHADAPQ